MWGVMMKQTRVNIRELKSRLSHYLRLAKAGESVEIMERGTPIGRIIPTAFPIQDRIEAMSQSGLLLWNKRKLKRMMPVARVRGKRTVAELLIEDRQ
jgi:prevent-host-death family protein